MARVVIYKRNHIYTRFNLCSTASHLNLSRLMTKPTKWSVRPAKTQINLGIRPVWSESSLSAWRSTGSLATHWAHSEDSDQTGCPGWSESLLGAHIILLVLSWGGSFIYINLSLLLYQTFDLHKVQWFICISVRHQFLCLLLLDGNYIIDSAGCVIFSKRFNFTQESLDISPVESLK